MYKYLRKIIQRDLLAVIVNVIYYYLFVNLVFKILIINH
jgi:hypothetical protein